MDQREGGGRQSSQRGKYIILCVHMHLKCIRVYTMYNVQCSNSLKVLGFVLTG